LFLLQFSCVYADACIKRETAATKARSITALFHVYCSGVGGLIQSTAFATTLATNSELATAQQRKVRLKCLLIYCYGYSTCRRDHIDRQDAGEEGKELCFMAKSKRSKAAVAQHWAGRPARHPCCI